MKDLYNNIQVRPTLAVATRTNATATGTTIDRNYNGAMFNSVMFLLHTGTMTDGSVAVTVEESDDNSAWSTATALQGTAPTIASTDDDKLYEIGYLGGKRYVRVKAVTSGATSGGTFGATAVLGDPRVAPVVRP